MYSRAMLVIAAFALLGQGTTAALAGAEPATRLAPADAAQPPADHDTDPRPAPADPRSAATTRVRDAVYEALGPNRLARGEWLERFYSSRQGPEHTETFKGTFRIDRDGALDLNHIAGDVRVAAGSGNEVRIEAIKRVRHRDANEAKRLLAATRVDVTQVGGRLEVRSIYPRTNSGNFSGSVDYTITVPASIAVAIKTISGDVSVRGVEGEVRAETISGDVEVIATPNLALAKTVSGDVRAEDIASDTVTLGTMSGTVIASDLKVRTLEAGSVSGDLRLSALQIERLTAKTLSGSILFDGELARGGRYEFHAHSGDIRLTLADQTPGFELDASTFNGSIRSDFPVVVRTPTEGKRGVSSRAIRGTYGDASAILAVRSFSGTVVIVRK